MRAAIFAKRVAEKLHCEYGTLERFVTFAKAPQNVLQSLDYRDTLPESFFGELLRLMHFPFDGEESLTEEEIQTLRNSIINARDERRDKGRRDAGRTRYTSKQKLLMEHLGVMVSESGRQVLERLCACGLTGLLHCYRRMEAEGARAVFLIPTGDCW